MSYVTPVTLTLDEGTYEVEVPATRVIGTKNYSFSAWEDGSINPKRTVVLSQNMTINANYVEVSQTGTLTVEGTVTYKEGSNQIPSVNRVVSILVKLPSGSNETLTDNTDSTGAYSVSKVYAPGAYGPFTISVAEDAVSKAASITLPTVTIGKADTTITGNVSVV